MPDHHRSVQDGAISAKSRLPWSSVVRALVFGVAAAGLGALVYSVFVSVTGWELGLLAILLGLLVGWSVSAGKPSVPTGWVRAISVLLTLFSLMLSQYLVLWRIYDESGFSVPIPVDEAGRIMWDHIYRNPESLLIWGFALLVAFGFAHNAESEKADSGDAAGVVAPRDGAGRSLPLVQFVEVRQHPLRAADFDLFVVLPAPLEGVTLRRVSGVLSDLPRALPHLFDLDPDVVAASGDPVNPRRVEDQAFATLDLAKDAAQAQSPEADPKDWVDGDAFRSTIQNDPGFRQSLRPSEQRVGTPGRITIGIASVAVFAAVMYGGGQLKVLMGLDTPELKGTLPYAAFDVINFVIAAGLAIVTGVYLARVLARRHLARVLADPASAARLTTRGGLPSSAPDRLVLRPATRTWWLGVWLTLALGMVGVGASMVTGPSPEPTLLLIFTGVAVLLGALGTLGLRWGIVADQDGVTLSGTVTTAHIRWSDLEGIDIEKEPPGWNSVGHDQLVFITRHEHRVAAHDFLYGTLGPRSTLVELRHTLLAMRARHLSTQPATPDVNRAPSDAPPTSPAPPATGLHGPPRRSEIVSPEGRKVPSESGREPGPDATLLCFVKRPWACFQVGGRGRGRRSGQGSV